MVKKAGIEFAIIKAGGSDAGFYTDSNGKQITRARRQPVFLSVHYYFVGKDCRDDGYRKSGCRTLP